MIVREDMAVNVTAVNDFMWRLQRNSFCSGDAAELVDFIIRRSLRDASNAMLKMSSFHLAGASKVVEWTDGAGRVFEARDT